MEKRTNFLSFVAKDTIFLSLKDHELFSKNVTTMAIKPEIILAYFEPTGVSLIKLKIKKSVPKPANPTAKNLKKLWLSLYLRSNTTLRESKKLLSSIFEFPRSRSPKFIGISFIFAPSLWSLKSRFILYAKPLDKAWEKSILSIKPFTFVARKPDVKSCMS